jgi:hypothetical protein
MTCGFEGSDGGAPATPVGDVGSCGVDVRLPSDWGIPKQKARDGILRAGFCKFRDDAVMPVIFPTCRIVFERSTNCGKFDEIVLTN